MIVYAGFCINTNFEWPFPGDSVVESDNVNLPIISAQLKAVSKGTIESLLANDKKSDDSDGILLYHLNDLMKIDKYSVCYLYCQDYVGKASDQIITKTLIKSGLGILSYFYDRVVLHGNLISIDEKAYIIVAPSGVGKSTMTAALIRYHNAQLVSEDSVYLESDGKTVYAGSRELYLFRDSAMHVIGEVGSSQNSEKHSYSFYDHYCCRTVYPVEGVIELTVDELSEDIICYRMKKNQALLSLMQNIKYKAVLNEKQIFNSVGVICRMLSCIPVYRVSLKRGYQYLDKQMKKFYNSIVAGTKQ